MTYMHRYICVLYFSEVYSRRDQFSPRAPSRQCFDYEEKDDYSQRLGDQDSSALLSQLIGQLSKRKRKTSERCECDCDERSAKKKRSGEFIF